MNLISPLILPSAKPRLSIAKLHQQYRAATLTPGACIRALLQRLDAADDNPVWISRVPAADLLLAAARCDARLRAEGPALLDVEPLFGVPYAVKDNIDVAGLPTTSACPAFAYQPQRHAVAVQRLQAAGALLVGKTNLDQFATGLVGTRSPYGVVRHPEFPDYIAGGSSSGSAVAVAQGFAAFALGTDTAGSGRIPAGFNGLVGIKPSRGLVSTRGVAPACRSLDCVSVFANDVIEAWAVLQVLAGGDAEDPYSRTLPALPACSRELVLGIPQHCEFFGDRQAQTAFETAVERLRALKFVRLQTLELSEIFATAALLYQGPWLAERRAALGSFFDRHAADIDPSVREIISAADRYSAVDAFAGQYRLERHRAAARAVFAGVDALLVPTAPMHPRIDDVRREPIAVNSRLGYYTNFVNLLDLAALAIPASRRQDGLPAGVTLLAPAGADHRLASMAQPLTIALQGGTPVSPIATVAFDPLPFSVATIDVAVVGAHLSGQPLNAQLLDCGARLLRCCRTAAHYRLYALAGTVPAKPGLVRVDTGGVAIEVEVWRMPLAQLGCLLSWVASPLAIGSTELDDGSWVKGFVCEPFALSTATDISRYAGWRAYLADRRADAPASGSGARDA